MQSDPLAQLATISTGEPVSIWPLAPGYWLIIGLVTVILLSGLYSLRRYRQKRALKRQGLRQLAIINCSTERCLQHYNALLKSLCIAYFPNCNLAHLHSDDWLAFLTKHYPKAQDKRTLESLARMQQDLYKSTNQNADEAIIDATTKWIKHSLPPRDLKAGEIPHV